MAAPGPFDRVWALLRRTALRPGPAATYLLLLALAWPAYRLWSVGRAQAPPPLAAPAVVTVTGAAAELTVPAGVEVLVRIPAGLLAPGGTPAVVALVRDGRDAWQAPVSTARSDGAGVEVLLADGVAAGDGSPPVLEVRDAAGAPLLRATLVPGSY